MQHIQLSIPEPCHQNWNEMTTADQGRFCSACAKTVVDFTTMSDASLTAYFQNLKDEKVCGRMAADQVERAILIPPAPKNKIVLYWQYLLAFCLFLTRCHSGQAQGELKLKKSTQCKVENISNVIMGDTMMVAPADNILPEKITITDEDGVAIPNVTVKIKTSNNTRSTGIDGVLERSALEGADTIVLTSVGYQQKIVKLDEIGSHGIQLQKQVFDLQEVQVRANGKSSELNIFAGGLSVTRISVNSLADTLKSLVTFKPALLIYPNPVAKNSQVNVQFKAASAGRYSLEITSANGAVLMRQKYQAAAKQINKQLPIPSAWATGVYFISIFDEQHKRLATEKFVLQ